MVCNDFCLRVQSTVMLADDVHYTHGFLAFVPRLSCRFCTPALLSPERLAFTGSRLWLERLCSSSFASDRSRPFLMSRVADSRVGQLLGAHADTEHDIV